MDKKKIIILISVVTLIAIITVSLIYFNIQNNKNRPEDILNEYFSYLKNRRI